MHKFMFALAIVIGMSVQASAQDVTAVGFIEPVPPGERAWLGISAQAAPGSTVNLFISQPGGLYGIGERWVLVSQYPMPTGYFSFYYFLNSPLQGGRYQFWVRVDDNTGTPITDSSQIIIP